MFCAECGAGLAPTSRYCTGCGTARAAEPDPGPLAAARRLATAGRPGGAVDLLADALTDAPEDRSLRLGLAAALLQTGDWTRGLDVLEGLRAPDRFDPIVEAYIAGALLGLGRVADAKAVLDRAQELAPGDPSIALKRGELFCRLAIYPTAVIELERVTANNSADQAIRQAAVVLLRFARERSKRGFVRRFALRRQATPVGVGVA